MREYTLEEVLKIQEEILEEERRQEEEAKLFHARRFRLQDQCKEAVRRLYPDLVGYEAINKAMELYNRILAREKGESKK